MSILLPCTSIITEIAAERRRQMEVEGWTPQHDDAHSRGQMAQAAACYADPQPKMDCSGLPLRWPETWEDYWWKPKDRRRNLVRAAALIVAEIERLDRIGGGK